MEEKIVNEIIEIISTSVDDESLEINADSSLMDDLDLSSLEVFTIFSEIEEKFAYKISEEEIASMATVNDLANVILKHVGHSNE